MLKSSSVASFSTAWAVDGTRPDHRLCLPADAICAPLMSSRAAMLAIAPRVSSPKRVPSARPARSPKLGLPLVNPQQAALHGRAIVGRPESAGRRNLPFQLWVYSCGKRSRRSFVLPLGEVAARHAVLGTAMMLQSNAALALAHESRKS